jgi:hypothetical protein
VAGQQTQGASSIAIGRIAGNTSQGPDAIAIGFSAAQTNQQTGAIAIGSYAGRASAGSYSVCIGYEAGQTNAGNSAVHIGYRAGAVGSGGGVIIGSNCGQTNAGVGVIAISGQGNLEADNANSFYIRTIALDPTPSANWAHTCYYNRTAYNATTNKGAFSIANFTSLRKNKVIIDEFNDTSSILDLQMYRYYYKNQVETQTIEHGYIADDLYAVDSNLVAVDTNNEVHGLHKDNLLFFCINELKKLRKEFDELSNNFSIYKLSHP